MDHVLKLAWYLLRLSVNDKVALRWRDGVQSGGKIVTSQKRVIKKDNLYFGSRHSLEEHASMCLCVL